MTEKETETMTTLLPWKFIYVSISAFQMVHWFNFGIFLHSIASEKITIIRLEYEKYYEKWKNNKKKSLQYNCFLV